MQDPHGGGGAATKIEWDQEQLDKYFAECEQNYSNLAEALEALTTSFTTFAQDPDHLGPEAEAARAFIEDRQIPLHEDLTSAVQELTRRQKELLEAFNAGVDGASNAILKEEQLEKVRRDFKSKHASFNIISHTITQTANDLNASCAEFGPFTVPDPAGVKEQFEAFDTWIETLIQTFKDFDTTQASLMKSSGIKESLEKILYAVKSMISSLGSGESEAKAFTDVNRVLEEALASGGIDPADVKAFEAFVEDLDAYFREAKPHCQVFGYDPVNLCTGGYIEEKEDIGVGGRYPVSFKRAYNALKEEAGILGKGWSTNAEQRLLKEDDKTYIRITETGGEDRYVKAGEDDQNRAVYLEAHGEAGVLKEEAGKGCTITYDGGRYLTFDKEGYFQEEGDHNGWVKRVAHDAKRPVKIEAPNGVCLYIAYNEEGYVKSVTDHTGRKVTYAYEEGRLKEVITLTGHKKRYVYDERGLLSEGYNARGYRYVKNEYLEDGRIKKQTLADGSETAFSYEDERGETKAREANGNEVIYYRDERKRHTGTKYYDGEEHYTYNERNLKTSYTDKRGNTTKYRYDNKGRLTGVTNALKETLSITYDAEGRVSVVKDALGKKTSYGYDIYGNLSVIEDASGNSTKLYYEGRELLKIKDALGNETAFMYDEAGNVRSVTDADGVTTRYESDALNRIVKTTDASGNKVLIGYDEEGRVTETENALGEKEEIRYNASGKIEEVLHADKSKETFSYNERGKLVSVRDEEGNETKIDYDRMGREETITLPNGGKVRYERDLLGRVIKEEDAEGRTTEYTLDAEGNVIEERQGEEVLARTYDALNRVSKTTDALGRTRVYGYDKNGNLTAVTNPKGGVTRYEYDETGRLVKEILPDNEERVYTYTKTGKIESVLEDGIKTLLSYTKAGRLESVSRNGHIRERYLYDAAGRVHERVFSDGYALSFTYDALNRVKKIQDSRGRALVYTYDERGRIIEAKDEDTVTRYSYTKTGELKSVTDALGSVSRYEYDALRNLSLVDYQGQVTTYERDLTGRILKVIDAASQEETYTYNREGRLSSKTDKDKNTTSYVYNRAGLVAQVTYGDGKKVLLSYDPLDKIKEIIDDLGTTVIENDALGRVTKVTDPEGKEVSYGYAAGAKRSHITYPDGHSVYYTYDEDGNLSTLTNRDSVTSYAYDENGRLTKKLLPNGTRQMYAYAQGGFLTQMESYDKEGLLDRYTYEYNAKGLKNKALIERRNLPEVSGTYTYAYDILHRLTGVEQNGEMIKRYAYDARGNRSMQEADDHTTTYTYDILDRLTKEVITGEEGTRTKGYRYDKRGNLSEISVNSFIEKTFTFDARNFLTEATDADKGSICHTYNGLGFRVSTKTPEEEIRYLNDFTRQFYNLLERTVNDVTEQFAYDGNVTSMTKENEEYFYLQDALGSPMYLTGTDGAPVSSYAFDDFGASLDPRTGKRRHHPYTKQGNIIQPFAFTGYQEDDITGLHFAQARYYDSTHGRFISEDKVRGFTDAPKTLNHYIYCWNNPEDYVDLDGDWPANLTDALCLAGTCAAAFAGGIALAAAAPALGVVATATIGGALIGGTIAGIGSVLGQTQGGGHVDVKKYFTDVAFGGIGGALAGFSIATGTFASSAVKLLKSGLINAGIEAATGGTKVEVATSFLGGCVQGALNDTPLGVMANQIVTGELNNMLGITNDSHETIIKRSIGSGAIRFAYDRTFGSIFEKAKTQFGSDRVDRVAYNVTSAFDDAFSLGTVPLEHAAHRLIKSVNCDGN